jgi:hypothetical protein
VIGTGANTGKELVGTSDLMKDRSYTLLLFISSIAAENTIGHVK